MSASNGGSNLSAPSVDADTINSSARTSLDRSADTIAAELARPTSPLRREKERMSGDSQATERDKKGRRVQQILKNQVSKQSARIGTISKKIGHGVSRGNIGLHRSTSAPGQPLSCSAQNLLLNYVLSNRFARRINASWPIPSFFDPFPKAFVVCVESIAFRERPRGVTCGALSTASYSTINIRQCFANSEHSRAATAQ